MAYKTLYSYDVFDTEANEYILENAKIDEVCDKITISKKNVANYAAREYLYKRKFRITRNPTGEEAAKVNVKPSNAHDNRVDDIPKWLQDEWEAVCFMINPNRLVGGG